MQLVGNTPQFATADPTVLHFNGSVRVSLPLVNIGAGDADSVSVDQITLNNVPAVGGFLPRVIGTLRQGNVGAVNAGFSNTGLVVGGRYTLRVRGRYVAGGRTSGFIVNRAIVVPAPTVPPIQLLRGRVDHLVSAGVWSYTVVNAEPIGSSQSVMAFSLTIVAPVVVTGTPVGWQVLTDGSSYVLWHTDPSSGFQIQPGTSAGGFTLTSGRSQSEGTAFSLSAWNYETAAAGLVLFGATASPARG